MNASTLADDEQMMRHALALAAQGRGYVEPNPQVGAVVLDADGMLCGEGWHQRFGGPHAEVFALQQAGARAAAGTLYVTLEPCSHHGKTPPCADAVIAAGLRRVVIGCIDPAPHVNRAGITRLRAAGIQVDVGVLATDSEAIIAPFRTLMLERRPFVHAKWAMSLDGRIATRTGHSKWISGVESRAQVHLIRGQMDGIVVGSGTALADDPLLTARPPGARDPLRIVLDSQARLPVTSQLVQTARELPVLLFALPTAPVERVSALVANHVEVQLLPADAAGRVDIHAVLAALGQRHLTHLLVEGGSGVLGTLWDQQLIDEVHVFVAPKILGGTGAVSPVGGAGVSLVADSPTLQKLEWTRLGDDLYLNGRIHHAGAGTADETL